PPPTRATPGATSWPVSCGSRPPTSPEPGDGCSTGRRRTAMLDPRHLAANGLVLGLAAPASLAFHRATRDVTRVQARVLRGILARGADSAFGRRHGLGAIRSVEGYPARVSLSDYEDYREAVDRVAAGEAGGLAAGPGP